MLRYRFGVIGGRFLGLVIVLLAAASLAHAQAPAYPSSLTYDYNVGTSGYDVPAGFTTTELADAITQVGHETKAEFSCKCGKPSSCECGACGDCCTCKYGHFGWLHGYAAPWDGTVELGLNGATGNTNNSNLFFGFDGKREYYKGDLTFDFDYFYQKANSVVSANRAVALSRYERELNDRGLSWYTELFYEYDQLRNYNGRVAINSGLSKELYDTDRFSLTGRAGLGASKKIDAIDDQWRPELQLGVDYEYRITERQKIFGFVDFYPDLSDFSTYRLNYKLAYENLLEEEWGLALRASLMSWFDSDPGPDTTDEDLYYTLSLTWGY